MAHLVSERANVGVKELYVKTGNEFASLVEITYIAGQVTRKDQTSEELLQSLRSSKDPAGRIKKFAEAAIKKSHASVATLPKAVIEVGGTRVIDYYYTASTFGDYLAYSQRIIEPKIEDIGIPDGLSTSNKLTFEIEVARQHSVYINLSKWLEEHGDKRNLEKARRTLGFAFPSRIEAVIAVEGLSQRLKDAHLHEGDPYFPKELIDLAKQMQKESVRLTMWPLIDASLNSDTFGFDQRNIFVNPESDLSSSNAVTRIAEKRGFPKTEVVVAEKLTDEEALKEFLSRYRRLVEKSRVETLEFEKSGDLVSLLARSKENNWKLAQLSQNHSGIYDVQVLSFMSIAMWNEAKRHRTLPQIPESVYTTVGRAGRELERGDDSFVYYPLRAEYEAQRVMYFDSVRSSLATYSKLLGEGAKPAEAIYVTPQGAGMYVLQDFNIFQLFSPFGYNKVRNCYTAEVEIRERTRGLVDVITKSSKYSIVREEFGNLLRTGENAYSKCSDTGVCPESDTCAIVYLTNPKYSTDLHNRLGAMYTDIFTTARQD